MDYNWGLMSAIMKGLLSVQERAILLGQKKGLWLVSLKVTVMEQLLEVMMAELLVEMKV
jgi:hypothetical protein